MIDSNYVNDGMDIKKYMLCLLGRLPLVLGEVGGGVWVGLVG